MKKLLSLILGTCIFASAKMLPGENILLNGDLEERQIGFPAYWTQVQTSLLTYHWTGGPDASGAWRFESTETSTVQQQLVQSNIPLPAGETFKLSMKVRTKNFKAKAAGFVIKADDKEQGIMQFPENASEWQKLEISFKLNPSQNGKYNAVLYLDEFSGQIDFAQLSLTGISEKALELSEPTEGLPYETRPRVFPYSTLLREVPVDNPVIVFKRAGSFSAVSPSPENDVEAIFTLDGKEVTRAAATKEISCNLGEVAQGAHKLNVKLVKKGEETPVYERNHNIKVIEKKKYDLSGQKRLNNFVTEIVNRKVNADEKIQFNTAKDGWLFISADNGIDLDGMSLKGENFRYVKEGPHTASITDSGNVIIRSIAEIFVYSLCSNSKITQNPEYNWEFHEKYIFPAMTSPNGGACPEDKLPLLKEKGLHWFSNTGTITIKDKNDLLERLKNAKGLHDDTFAGTTCDEHYYSQTTLPAFADGIWDFEAPEDKFVYTWTTGVPDRNNMVDSEHVAAALNASNGAKLFVETYCASQPDEATARAYIARRCSGCYNAYKACHPAAEENVALIAGNFSQAPVLSLDVNPEVDFKYNLELEMNYLATHPDFAKMPSIGYWGNYYSPEEMLRWSAKLLRHYCVDGRTDMLSDQYGFKYIPGHLMNGDFTRGFESWKIDAPEDAPARLETVPQLRGFERWGSDWFNGTTCCVIPRGETATKITQEVKGLTPGKTYVLQFITGSYDALKQGVYDSKLHRISVDFENKASVIRTYKIDGEANAGGPKSTNVHYWKFKANAENFTLTISNDNFAKGETITLNFVSIKPYYED